MHTVLGRRIGLIVSFVFAPTLLLALVLVLAPAAGARSAPEGARVAVASIVEAVTPTLSFTAYEGNPVVEPGPPGEWDELIIGAYAVYTDGVTYLFYIGWLDWFYGPMSIGYVTSTNGITFSERLIEPILAGDGSGFDARAVGMPVVLLEGNTWTLYYAGDEASPPLDGEAVGMATANDPAGLWTRLDDPVLAPGSPGEWDDKLVWPSSVIAANGTYTMYYAANSYADDDGIVGMATANDPAGPWVKYDDPATTDPPYAESDPVLMPGEPGSWDSAGAAGARVRKTQRGWEMFYTGVYGPYAIGYAWSGDGIHWVKHPDNPIYTGAQDPNTIYVEMASLLVHGSTYWMYYDYHRENGIGLATGAVQFPIEVTTTDDELNADGDCSLREAIQAANTDAAVDACPAGFGHDIVIVPAGTYTLTIPGAYEDLNQTGDLDIRGDLTLQGAGAEVTIIDGNALDRVIHNHHMNVEVSDLTITNGAGLSGSGAGLRNDAGTMTLDRCIISGNVSTDYAGGGLYNSGGAVTLNQCIVSGNTAYIAGGLHNAPLGPGSRATLVVNDSLVISNTATLNGAGIINRCVSGSPNSTAILTVTQSTIRGNVADGSAASSVSGCLGGIG